jgi:hypothetical protein
MIPVCPDSRRRLLRWYGLTILVSRGSAHP